MNQHRAVEQIRTTSVGLEARGATITLPPQVRVLPLFYYFVDVVSVGI
jgi:hypothetical protein